MAMIALLLLADAPASAVSEDVLAPARAGMLQCYEPDESRKTCRSIAAYRRTVDNSYVNTATILVSPTGPLTLETDTEVTVKRGAVCGAITEDSVAQGKLRLSGTLLSKAQSTPILGKLKEAMASLIGKEICTTYLPSGDAFTTSATLNGTAMPGEKQRVKWISPTDGFVVAAPN